MKRAVLFDRDNTLIKDPGYFHDPDRIELLEGAADALRDLRAAGYSLFVITNQSGIGRGIFPADAAEAVHRRLIEILAKEGVVLDAIYYCPHHPDEGCECRKPNPYLIRKAAREHDIDLAQSFFVGNDAKDMQTGKNAGLKTVAVFFDGAAEPALTDFRASDLREAAKWILAYRA